MKKYILVFTLVFVMLFTIAMPTALAYYPKKNEVMTTGTYDGLTLSRGNTVTIDGDISFYDQGGIKFLGNSTLIITSNGSLKGNEMKAYSNGINNIIKIDDGGSIDITFKDKENADLFGSILSASNITYARKGNEFKAGSAICSHENTKVVCEDCGEVVSDWEVVTPASTAGTMATGSGLTIAVAGVIAAIGIAAGTYCLRGQKKEG